MRPWFALIAIVSGASFAQDASTFRFTEARGPHAVGLLVVEQYDYSRVYRALTDEFGKSYSGERARPLQTLIWYPARRGGGRAMTVEDYLNLWARETSYDHPQELPIQQTWRSALKPSLANSLWAVRDVPPAPEKFPLLVYAPGASQPSWDNADLCEYLASHGYIVVSSSSVGDKTRTMSLNLSGANTQARDILFLLGYGRALPHVDPSKIAVIGMSWGGIANVFAAARDDRIQALVSLDGSLRYYPSVMQEAGDVNPQQLAIPLLAFVQRNYSLEIADRYSSPANRAASPNAMNAWTHGDLVYVHMLGLAHATFSSFFQRNEDKWRELLTARRMEQGDYNREDGMVGYAWMARYTLQFLNAYLKRDDGAMTFLRKTPAQNGVPPHTIVVDFRAATGITANDSAAAAQSGEDAPPDE